MSEGKRAIVFVGPPGSGKTYLVNKLFGLTFDSGPSTRHVTKKKNISECEGCTIIDAVGHADVKYKDFGFVRVVNLCCTPRIDDSRDEWNTKHPILKDNVWFVLSWQFMMCHGPKSKSPVEFNENVFKPWNSLTREEILLNIPQYNTQGTELNLPPGGGIRDSQVQSNSSVAQFPEKFKLPSFIEEIVPTLSIKELEKMIIKNLRTLEDVKKTRILGDSLLKTMCLLKGRGVEDDILMNTSICDFLERKMPKFLEHIKGLYVSSDTDELTHESIADGLEAVVGWTCDPAKKLKRYAKSLVEHYICDYDSK